VARHSAGPACIDTGALTQSCSSTHTQHTCNTPSTLATHPAPVATQHAVPVLACPQASLAAANNAGANGGPKKRLGDAVGWFKGLGAAATNMVGSGGSRAADAAEDPEYIKVGHWLQCGICAA
jgi:hypothetical protein